MSSPLPTFPTDHLPPPPTTRRRWPTLLFALIIFLAGLVCGAGLTVVFVVDRLQHAIHHPEAAPARIAATLARRLDLSEEQQTEVEAIVAKRQREIAAIRREFQPQVQSQLELVRDEINDVLDESQREHWSELFEQFQRRWLPPLVPSPAAEKKADQSTSQP